MSDANGVLHGCEVLPPLNSPSPSRSPAPRRPEQSKEKAVGRSAARGRFAAINAFLDVTARDLELSQIVVWILLWRDTKPDGLARTATADIARRTGASKRTVLRAVKTLAKAGLLAVVRVGNLRVGPSVYRVRPTPAR
jgi:hypothetical protein